MNTKKFAVGILNIILLFLAHSALAQMNAMEDDIIKKSGVLTDEEVYPLSPIYKQSTFVYYDGMGRPIQQVAQNASPLQNDIVQPIVYDNLGRQTTSYLPYSDVNTGTSGVLPGSYRSTALTEQSTFYSNTGQYLVATDADPYSQTVFEKSPLQRLLEAGMVGSNFHGN